MCPAPRGVHPCSTDEPKRPAGRGMAPETVAALSSPVLTDRSLWFAGMTNKANRTISVAARATKCVRIIGCLRYFSLIRLLLIKRFDTYF